MRGRASRDASRMIQFRIRTRTLGSPVMDSTMVSHQINRESRSHVHNHIRIRRSKQTDSKTEAENRRWPLCLLSPREKTHSAEESDV